MENLPLYESSLEKCPQCGSANLFVLAPWPTPAGYWVSLNVCNDCGFQFETIEFTDD